MNWKVVLLLCAFLFATALITSFANTAILSLTSTQNMLDASNGAILDNSFIEPEGGDEVDNPVAPK